MYVYIHIWACLELATQTNDWLAGFFGPNFLDNAWQRHVWWSLAGSGCFLRICMNLRISSALFSLTKICRRLLASASTAWWHARCNASEPKDAKSKKTALCQTLPETLDTQNISEHLRTDLYFSMSLLPIYFYLFLLRVRRVPTYVTILSATSPWRRPMKQPAAGW